MKKSLWPLTVAGLLVLALLPSCAPAAPSPSGTASPVPSVAETTPTLSIVEPTASPTPVEQTVVPTPTPAEPTPTPVPALDFNKEPPLDEFSASIAVPDFLTEEQQDLYRRASFFYKHMFHGETTALDEIRGDTKTEDVPGAIEQDGLHYYPATGRYRKWSDFNAVIHGLFTDDFWQQRNRNAMDGPPIYKEIDGRLWMADISRGNSGYNGNFPDEFRLESQSGDSILFTLIGHYSDEQPREGESFEERDARLEREYEYTLEFPIRLVLTENGWRFDEFYSASGDAWRYETWAPDAQRLPKRQRANESGNETFVTPAPTTAPLDFNKEPPLDEFSASIAVPDFLTPEQQDLYRRAHCLYQNMFGGFTAAIDFNFQAAETVEWEEPAEDLFILGDWAYQPAQGRYQRWADFDATVHSVFTDRFWESKNILSDGLPIYRNFGGRLGFREFERGSGYYYNENFPDGFRLDDQTEEEISFTLIGHYSWKWPKEGETYEERDARLEREYDQTKEFPIRMVLTENGWRFDEFHAALADEPDTIEETEAMSQRKGPRQ